MATRYEVRWISKADRYNPHMRILMFGGVNSDGKRWWVTQGAAIDGIRSGRWQFYVNHNGKAADVVVATSAYGHKYLRTKADDRISDNLLSLPRCPQWWDAGRQLRWNVPAPGSRRSHR